MYNEEEFEMVHSWLEKRVWVLEQGPLDGLVSSAFKWNNFLNQPIMNRLIKKLLICYGVLLTRMRFILQQLLMVLRIFINQ